jgi:hypothetical protein
LSDLQSTQRTGASQSGNAMISILIGAVLAQMMALGFLLYQISRVRNMVDQTRQELTQAK